MSSMVSELTSDAVESHEDPGSRAGRVRVFDAVRGFSIASMVLFHLCYDLKFIAGVPLPWFAPPLQDVWRATISWTFLFVAGCMCALSRDNLKRGLVYGCFALAVYLVTLVAAVDTPISFGIIFCMAASTLLEWALERMGVVPRGPLAALVLFLLFLLVLHVPQGYVGLMGVRIALPQQLYSFRQLAWIGLPGPGFASGDYYPLVPYALMYLAGCAMGRAWKARGYPDWAYKPCCPPLEFLGRHALLVYALHQPVLLVVAQAVLGA